MKRFIALLAALLIVLGTLTTGVASAKSDFVIKKGVLTKYTGIGGAVVADGKLLNGRSWGSTLDETYGQLRFDKATGWSRWLRLNQQEPNLKCFVDLHNFNR